MARAHDLTDPERNDPPAPGQTDVPQSARRPAGLEAQASQFEIIPYAAPMFAYVAAGSLEAYLPQAGGQASVFWYPLAYAAKLALVMILAWHYRATWRDFRPWPTPLSVALAILCGFLVWGLWVGLDGHYPALSFLPGQKRIGFDPTAMAPGPRWAFILVRLLGLVVVVPVIEELFWRSFLLRWLIDLDFARVPIGRVTPTAAGLSSLFFALVHPEWLPAVLTGLLWAGLLWKTRSLSACVISHATANLALGLYVLVTAEWKYW
jgi:CAAX prenyl protease-like protein